MTVHIEGFAKDIDLREKLVEFGKQIFNSNDFPYDEPGEAHKLRIFFRMYESRKPCPLDEALEGYVVTLFGGLSAVGECYGYSEVTIEGFTLQSLKLGGHDLQKLIDAKAEENWYLHILIDRVPVEQK